MKITFIVAAVTGFALGTVWGCYEAGQASGNMQSAGVMASSSAVSDFAPQQFEHADRFHALQAVRLQIKTLEQLERAGHDSSSDFQLGYAYTRLAMVEEVAGQTDAERNALDRARGWFRQAHS